MWLLGGVGLDVVVLKVPPPEPLSIWLVQRGLAEYKAGLLSLFGRIIGRGKGYKNRLIGGGETVTTMG